jgi:hypothetical protein
MQLQVNNNRNIASIVTKNFTDAMLRGDSSEVNIYVNKMKAKQLVNDLKKYTIDGVDTTAFSFWR